MKGGFSTFESAAEDLPQYYIGGFHGNINSSNVIQKTIILNTSTKATFQAYGTDATANYEFTLTNPLEVSITSEIDDPNISYVYEDGYMIYTINNPEAGEWYLEFSTSTTNDQQYGISIFEDSYIGFVVSSQKDWTNTGQSIILLAELSDNAGAVTGATVIANITLPDESVQTITLYDDGTNGDDTADDGIYSFTFSATTREGSYSIEARATGTVSTGTFERTSTAGFTASSADILIDSPITEEGVDTNANGVYDLLRFTVPVQVSVEKGYRLTASLLDSTLETIEIVNSGILSLTTDSNSISVEIDAQDIVKHNMPGPYTLHGIEISDADTGITTTAAEDFATAAYQLSTFEPLDSDSDGLSDTLEQSIGTLIDKPDTDEDGATDYQEVAYDNNSLEYVPAADSNPLVIDTDNDTMSDGYEIAYGLNPLVDDTLDDLDGDGLSNIYEYKNHLRADKIDTDDDGRNDKWEIDHGASPIVYDSYVKLNGDIDLDGATGITDLVFMADQCLVVLCLCQLSGSEDDDVH